MAAALPGWQAIRTLGVSTLGRPALVAVIVAATTMGTVAVGARLLLGDDAGGLALAASLGTVAYLVGLASARSSLHLDALWNGVRRRS